MTGRRVRIEEVLTFLGIEDGKVLMELRREGLFEAEEVEPEEADELRVATLLIRDLGVNAAGVEVALQLRRRLLTLEQRTARLLERLLDEEGDR